MTFLGLLVVAIIFSPFVLKRHREQMEWEEEQDRRERQRDAYLEHIASGRSGPPPQINRVPERETPGERYRQIFVEPRVADWVVPPTLALIVLGGTISALLKLLKVAPWIQSALDWDFFGPVGLRPVSFLIAVAVFLATCIAIRRLKDRFRGRGQYGIK